MTSGVLQDGPQALALGERNALRKFCRAKRGFEAPSRWGRIGLASMRSLVAKGLAVEGPPGVYGPTFKLTETGWLMVDRLENPRHKRQSKAGQDGRTKPLQRISVRIDMPAPAHPRPAVRATLGALFPLDAMPAPASKAASEQEETNRLAEV